jgi:acetyl-CoA carboxylase biotin carboxyl carrier protein
MPSPEIDPKTNGTSVVQSPSSARPTNPNAVQELGQELADLARNLSGSLHRLSVRSGDCEIEVEWHPPAPVLVAAGAAPSATDAEAAEPAGSEVAAPTRALRAPLVGTYYAAASPDADPFVRPGDRVEPGQTLAIVEAMKMMNPVVADEPGLVAEILVSNGQPVEFDQPLLLILPAEQPG